MHGSSLFFFFKVYFLYVSHPLTEKNCHLSLWGPLLGKAQSARFRMRTLWSAALRSDSQKDLPTGTWDRSGRSSASLSWRAREPLCRYPSHCNTSYQRPEVASTPSEQKLPPWSTPSPGDGRESVTSRGLPRGVLQGRQLTPWTLSARAHSVAPLCPGPACKSHTRHALLALCR